nr:methyltransferase domain-containing protein [candidate division Zixibacteria bacterium]
MARIEPFSRFWSEYEDWFEKNHFAYISELHAVRKQLPENEKRIEIGVGTGRFAAPLGIKLGLEPSAPMRKIAEQRGIQVVGGVAEELPFADKQFDLVLMVTTICFLDDVTDAFRETRRILKPTGHFVIGLIDKNSLLGKLYEKYKKNNKFYRMATFYSADEVATALEQAGFKDFNFVQTIFHPLSEIKGIEPVKDGYGQGSFVVIRGQK